jgi:hypothetical protein
MKGWSSMGNYSAIKSKASDKYKVKNRYADGGRVSAKKSGSKTVVNVIVPPSGPAAPMPPAPPAMPPMPPAPPAMPPAQGAGMAGIKAMQGFKCGGRVKRAAGGRVKAGAESGLGRLEKAKAAKAWGC